MRNLDLNEYGVQEMSHSEVKEVDGGELILAIIFVASIVIGAVFSDKITVVR